MLQVDYLHACIEAIAVIVITSVCVCVCLSVCKITNKSIDEC